MTKNSFLEYILHDAMRQIQGVTARAMFGGHGFYKNGVIFGILADDVLYFKVDDKNRPDYEARGSKAFTYEAKGRKKIAMSYWEVPPDVLEDHRMLAGWMDRSVAASRRQTSKKTPPRRKG